MKTKKMAISGTALLCLALLGLIVLGVGGLKAEAAAPNDVQSAGLLQYSPMQSLPDANCELVDNLRTCHLWAKTGLLDLPGITVNIWGFAASEGGTASLPGPVIRANIGETLQVVFHNQIPDETISLAFPGHEGIIFDLKGIPFNGTMTYTVNLTTSGSFLYEAGLTPGGTRQVAMGLAGPLIVEDGSSDWDQEVILVFSEIDPAFNGNPGTFSMLNFLPKFWLINGHPYPDTGWIEVAPGSTVLLRYINAGSQPRSIGILGLDQKILKTGGDSLPFPLGTITAQIDTGECKDALIVIPNGENDLLYPLYQTSLIQHNNNQRLADKRLKFGGTLTFLKATGEGGTPGIGPVVTEIYADPAKSNGSVDVTLTALMTDANSPVTHFEYFIDDPGAVGTGPLTAVENPGMTVTVTHTFTPEDLADLSGGLHTIYLRGQNQAGVWGSLGSTVLNLDKNGPVILGLGINPNPTNGSRDILLTGTADDRTTGNSIITAAEYRVDSGTWQPMDIYPVGQPYAGLSVTIPAASLTDLSEGLHNVDVRAMDEYDNWSSPLGTTILRLDKTGPDSFNVLLQPNFIDLSKPLPPQVYLTASILDPLVNGLQSNLATAEGFIGTAGAPGTGFALFPTDGLFNEPDEDVYYNIPGATFATLPPGEHHVLVRGRDQAGNWGPEGWAVITLYMPPLDTTGPVVSNVLANPNPTNGASSLVLTALATDEQSNIAGAIWFEGTKPPKRLTYMSAADGTFDQLVEDLVATIDISKWKIGDKQVSVRAYDAAGNWGDIVTIIVSVSK
jgi:hypothetical protein